jgi:hypothetical protein
MEHIELSATMDKEALVSSTKMPSIPSRNTNVTDEAADMESIDKHPPLVHAQLGDSIGGLIEVMQTRYDVGGIHAKLGSYRTTLEANQPPGQHYVPRNEDPTNLSDADAMVMVRACSCASPLSHMQKEPCSQPCISCALHICTLCP